MLSVFADASADLDTYEKLQMATASPYWSAKKADATTMLEDCSHTLVLIKVLFERAFASSNASVKRINELKNQLYLSCL